jgi:hypothetical protein
VSVCKASVPKGALAKLEGEGQRVAARRSAFANIHHHPGLRSFRARLIFALAYAAEDLTRELPAAVLRNLRRHGTLFLLFANWRLSNRSTPFMMPPGGLRHIGWRLIHPSA